ncbi:MAG: serine hydrolase domain-containing protein [Acidimicrobiales bacterium]
MAHADRPGPGARALVALPPQPEGTPWPADRWPEGDPPAGVDLEALLEAVFDEAGPLARTLAVVVVHRGRLVAERYGGRLEHLDRPAEVVGPDTALLSWSMAKSMLQAVVATLVEEGRLSLDGPAPVPEWAGPDDPRRAITVDDLLAMRDGLDFAEDYVDARASDVIEMLFGAGQADVAHFGARRGLAAPPGERFNYSSGTTNVLSGIVAREVGPGQPYRRFLIERLFGPTGMTSATATFDEAGTWVASSYVHATARDFARFGLLYLRDGVWDGRRVVAPGWVDRARTPRSVDPTDGALYGSHWWVGDDGYGTFRCAGYEGQRIVVCPALDLVVVRLGKTPAERYPALDRWVAGVVDAFAAATGVQAPS